MKMLRKNFTFLFGILCIAYFLISLWFNLETIVIENLSEVNDFSVIQDEEALNLINTYFPPKKFSNALFEAQRIYQKNGKHVLLAFINSAYKDLTVSWLCNTAQMDQVHENTLIVCTDRITCDQLHDKFPLVGFAVVDSDSFNNSLIWGQKKYINFLTLRTALILKLVSQGLPLILFETDAIWFRNPMDYLANASRSGHIVIPVKGYPEKGLSLSFDPMLINPSSTVVAFFTELSRQLVTDSRLYDQDVLDALCKQQFAGVHCETFPWELVADGLWFKLSPQKRDHLTPYIVNNNYYVGVNAKISRQALNGLWFVSVKGSCDIKKVAKITTGQLSWSETHFGTYS